MLKTHTVPVAKVLMSQPYTHDSKFPKLDLSLSEQYTFISEILP